MTKAQRALASAHTLLQDGDGDGACNRAYYAMFDAARAALIAAKSPVPPEIAKTHSGLIAAFSLHLVKTDLFPKELGRSFNKAEDLRLVARLQGRATRSAPKTRNGLCSKRRRLLSRLKLGSWVPLKNRFWLNLSKIHYYFHSYSGNKYAG